MDTSKKDKINLEKRLKGVEKIIKMMSDSDKVPKKIENSDKSSETSGERYSGCIKCSGTQPADVREKFGSDSVEKNVHSSNALNEFNNEKVRIEEAIREIEKQIILLKGTIEQLKNNISTCRTNKNECIRNMCIYSSEMDKWKRWIQLN